MDLAPERGVGMNWLERSRAPEGTGMVWETPIVTEIAVGMEVTSYVSGEDEVLL
jgi:coenzyme PQQ precursor peptide PqqA